MDITGTPTASKQWHIALLLLCLVFCGCKGSAQRLTQCPPLSPAILRGGLPPVEATTANVSVADGSPAQDSDTGAPVRTAAAVASEATESTMRLASAESDVTGEEDQRRVEVDDETISQNEYIAAESDDPDTESAAILSPPADSTVSKIAFDDVVQSVLRYYPLVRAAYLERAVADGNQLAAWGELDTKVKGVSENTPLGFYETYRNHAGIEQPLYKGGYVFGGYRNGRGTFEPWYEERNTNDGGELKGGFRVPLIRDKTIDGRRAEIWRRSWDQQLANPTIRASLIQFTAEAGYAYWKWVAAGQKYQLGVRWLELAKGRQRMVRERVLAEDLDPPDEIENNRAIAKRQAKLADSLRILEQAAQKLSIYLRDSTGRPFVPGPEQLPTFPMLLEMNPDTAEIDVAQARQRRPELESFALHIQRLRVDYAEAYNLTLPQLDALLAGSQDMGAPTSPKRDKSEFILDAGLYFEMPLQRRKGRGKMHAVQAKMAQVRAKQLIVSEKIAAEVYAARAGVIRSRETAERASEAASLADEVANFERINFEEGASDLLKVAFREQYALEAAEELVEARMMHFMAIADYTASLGLQQSEFDLSAAGDPE